MTDAEVERLVHETRACHDASDFPRLRSIAEQLIAHYRASGDTRNVAEAYRHLGTAQHYLQDASAAEASFLTALQLAEASGDTFLVAAVQICLGNLALEHHNDVATGRHYHRLAEPAVRAQGDRRRLGILLGNLSEMDRVEGLYEDALRYASESLAIFDEIGDDTRAAWQSINIALIRIARRDPVAALESLREARARLGRTPNNYWTAMFFDVATLCAVQTGDVERAATFVGFVEKWRDEQNVPRLYGLISGWYPPVVERLASAIDVDTFERLRRRGARLSLEEAYHLAEALSRV